MLGWSRENVDKSGQRGTEEGPRETQTPSALAEGRTASSAEQGQEGVRRIPLWPGWVSARHPCSCPLSAGSCVPGPLG